MTPESVLEGAAWAGVALVQLTLVALLGLLAWLAGGRGGLLDRGLLGGEIGVQRPVFALLKGADLALALDNQSQCDRLDAARRQTLHHFAPEHGRDLVAVQAVEDPACLLRIDERIVDVARLGERALDRGPSGMSTVLVRMRNASPVSDLIQRKPSRSGR